jgi:type I restriction enzyme S subunit
LNVDPDNFLSMPIKFPSFDEQKKIADCLSSLDELISAHNQKLEHLQTYKKGLMQQLFPAEGETMPRLRFPEFRNAPKWQEKPLNLIAVPITRKNKKGDITNVLTLSSDNGIMLQSEYFGKKIAGNNTNKYIVIEENDFVYNDRTTKLFTYGTIKRLSRHQNGIVSPIYKCFRFHKNQIPIFWEYYFESGFHENQLHDLVNEGARKGRFNISSTKFLTISIWQPSPNEQQKIADCISSLDEHITAQVQNIVILKEHKKGLTQKLFPSAIEVNK